MNDTKRDPEVATNRAPGDREFGVDEVHTGWRDRACNMAVLTPVLGRGWFSRGVPAALESLRKSWRSRVESLRWVGWEPLLSPTTVTYTRNCPPFGVRTET